MAKTPEEKAAKKAKKEAKKAKKAAAEAGKTGKVEEQAQLQETVAPSKVMIALQQFANEAKKDGDHDMHVPGVGTVRIRKTTTESGPRHTWAVDGKQISIKELRRALQIAEKSHSPALAEPHPDAIETDPIKDEPTDKKSKKKDKAAKKAMAAETINLPKLFTKDELNTVVRKKVFKKAMKKLGYDEEKVTAAVDFFHDKKQSFFTAIAQGPLREEPAANIRALFDRIIAAQAEEE